MCFIFYIVWPNAVVYYITMARKRQEIAVQVTIETQEEWEENLGKEGLTGTLHKPYYLSQNYRYFYDINSNIS